MAYTIFFNLLFCFNLKRIELGISSLDLYLTCVCLIQDDDNVEVTSGSPLPGVKVIIMLYHFLDWKLRKRSSFPASSFTSSFVS